jgi:adenine phosphoribosyltransferase
MKIEEVKNVIRDIVDFPQKGIVFKDLTTAFKNPEAMRAISEALKARYENLDVTKVVLSRVVLSAVLCWLMN